MLTIEVGGWPVGFHPPSRAWLNRTSREYQGFRTERKPEMIFEVETRKGADAPFRPRFSQKGSKVQIVRGDFRASLEGKRGDLKVRDNPHSFNSFLRVLWTRVLSERSGMLIHGAGLARGEDAFVFFGPSGFGKSTITRLSEKEGAGLRAFSDEVVVLSGKPGDFWLYGTPFWGELARKGRDDAGRLKAAFSLKKSNRNAVRKLTPNEGAKRLMKTVLWFDEDPGRTQNVLSTVLAAADRVPFFELEFTLQGGFWKEVASCIS